MSDVAAARPTLDKKRSIIVGLVGLAVMALIFARVIPRFGSYHGAIDSFEDMTPGALACIAASVALYLAAYGLPFVAATPGLSYRRSQQVNQASFAISNGVPAGGPFGLGLQYEMLASYGVDPIVSTAAITAVGVWGIFLTLGLTVLGVAAIQVSGLAASSYLLPAVLGVTLLVLVIVAFVLVVRSEQVARAIGTTADRLVTPIARRIRPGTRVDLVPAALKFRSDIADLVTRRWPAITGSQLSVSVTQFLIFYMSLRGVQGWGVAGTSLLAAFGAFGVAQIGLMIPVTPGGLGIVDAAIIAILTALGAGAGDATAADLVWRAASFVPQMIIGVVALIAWSRHGARALANREAARRERHEESEA
jgi:uncharacterized protein (TIRG00374 family)